MLFVRLSIVAIVAAASAPAFADESAPYLEKKMGSDTIVTFPDDPLDGKGLGSLGLTVGVGPKAARLNLMRPRLNFLTEMYKSVEHM